MKVNVFGMLFNLLAICAVSNFVLLSANGIPLSEEQKSDEVVSTLSSLSDSTTSTVKKAFVTSQSVEKSAPSSSSSSSENASVEGSSPTDTRPPYVFPADELAPKNDTALKILQKVSSQPSEEIKSNETSSNTSSSTSLSSTSTSSTTSSSSENIASTTLASSVSASNVTTESTTTPKEITEDDYDSINEEGDKSDSEIVQDDNEEKQEELEEEFAKNGSDKATINLFADPVTNEPALHSGHVALIFASSLIVLSVLAYIGLILWRSRLEGRYGMRQRLVTNDDYYNNNDVRYFGL